MNNEFKWWDSNFKKRLPLTIGESHEVIPRGHTVPVIFPTGTEVLVDSSGSVNESIQHNAYAIVRHNDRTYTCWLAIHVDGTYHIYIKSYDHVLKTWSNVYDVGYARTSSDTHNYPSLLITSEGSIYVFYGMHYTAVYYKKSILPEDISNWSSEVTVGSTSADHAYPRPIETENGDIYLFCRGPVEPRMSFYKSDDAGTTWTGPHCVAEDISGLGVRVYCGGAVYDKVLGRMHILPMFHWTNTNGRNLTYMYSDDFNTWYQADGTVVGYTVELEGSSSKEMIPALGDRDFSSASNWNNVSCVTYDEVTDLTITSTSTGQYCQLTFEGFVSGRKYQISYDHTNRSGSWRFEYAGGHGAGSATIGASQTLDFVCVANATAMNLVSTTAISDSDFDNFSIKEIEAPTYTTTEKITDNIVTGPFYHTNGEGLAIDANGYPHFTCQYWVDTIGEECPVIYINWNGTTWTIQDLAVDFSLPKMFRYRQGGPIYLEGDDIHIYSFVLPSTTQEYFGGELYKYSSADLGITWTGEYLTGNTEKGAGMIAILRDKPAGEPQELFYCRNRDLYWLKDDSTIYARGDGEDIRIVHQCSHKGFAPTPNTVGHWKFRGDLKGHGGSPDLISGSADVFSEGYSELGATALSSGDNLIPKITTLFRPDLGITIEALFKATGLDPLGTFFADANADSRGYALGLNADGYLDLYYADTTGFSHVIGNTLLDDGEWHKISCVIDKLNDLVYIYSDGIEDISSPFDVSDRPNSWGVAPTSATFLGSMTNLIMDEVIFTRELLIEDALIRTTLNHKASYELHRLPDRFNAEDTKLKFKLPRNLSVDAGFDADEIIAIYWDYVNAGSARKSGSEVFEYFEGFESYATGVTLDNKGDWGVSTNGIFQPLRYDDFATYGYSAHTNKLWSGAQSLLFDNMSGSGEIANTKTFDLTHHKIHFSYWDEYASGGHCYIEVGTTSGSVRFGHSNSGQVFAYFKSGGSWVDSSVIASGAQYHQIELKVSPKGFSLWGNGELIIANDLHITSIDYLKIGYDTVTSGDFFWDHLLIETFVDNDVAISIDTNLTEYYSPYVAVEDISTLSELEALLASTFRPSSMLPTSFKDNIPPELLAIMDFSYFRNTEVRKRFYDLVDPDRCERSELLLHALELGLPIPQDITRDQLRVLMSNLKTILTFRNSKLGFETYLRSVLPDTVTISVATVKSRRRTLKFNNPERSLPRAWTLASYREAYDTVPYLINANVFEKVVSIVLNGEFVTSSMVSFVNSVARYFIPMIDDRFIGTYVNSEGIVDYEPSTPPPASTSSQGGTAPAVVYKESTRPNNNFS